LCNKTALDTLEKLKTAPIEINDRNIWKGLEQFKNLSEEQDSKTENKKNKKK
jgi:hypothetical protein